MAERKRTRRKYFGAVAGLSFAHRSGVERGGWFAQRKWRHPGNARWQNSQRISLGETMAATKWRGELRRPKRAPAGRERDRKPQRQILRNFAGGKVQVESAPTL